MIDNNIDASLKKTDAERATLETAAFQGITRTTQEVTIPWANLTPGLGYVF